MYCLQSCRHERGSDAGHGGATASLHHTAQVSLDFFPQRYHDPAAHGWEAAQSLPNRPLRPGGRHRLATIMLANQETIPQLGLLKGFLRLRWT